MGVNGWGRVGEGDGRWGRGVGGKEIKAKGVVATP